MKRIVKVTALLMVSLFMLLTLTACFGVSKDEVVDGVVGLGTKVGLLDIEFDEEFDYSIVSTIEADPDDDKISIESPVGKALIGKKVNDIVKVDIPHGVVEYKVLSVSKIDG